MLSKWGYRDICKSTCNLLAKYRLAAESNQLDEKPQLCGFDCYNIRCYYDTIEGLAFASKAILRKKYLWLLRSATFIYTFH